MDAICKSQGALLDQIASEKGNQGCGSCGVVYYLRGDYLWGCAWTSTLSWEEEGRWTIVPMHTLYFIIFYFRIVDRTNGMKDRHLHIALPLMNISHIHAHAHILALIFLSRSFILLMSRGRSRLCRVTGGSVISYPSFVIMKFTKFFISNVFSR